MVLFSTLGVAERSAAQYFSDCLSTWSNATVIIPSDVGSDLGGTSNTLSAGDEVAVFTEDGLCAGMGTWTGEHLAIAAAGVNEIDDVGFKPGDALAFRIWNTSEEIVYVASAAFASCADADPLCVDSGTYHQDKIYTVTQLEASDDASNGGDALTVIDVAASGEQAPNVASNTIDDNLSTRWSTGGKGAWIRHTLSAETTLDRVGIAWQHGDTRRADFTIALSTDGSSWTTVYEGTSSGSTLDREYYAFDATPARYVRITGYGNTQNNWTSITEVDVTGRENQPMTHKQLAVEATSPVDETLPETVSLDSNYPNPARHQTIIPYAIPTPTHVVLDIYDLLGRRVARPVDTSQEPGRYNARIDVSRWSSGVYIYRLRAGDAVRQGRMVVVN
jgi:hypothetical protein